jgi:small ligand-binding sensory domain FIST
MLMPFAAALSTATRTSRAIDEACSLARAKLPQPPDVACVFFSPHHVEAVPEISMAIQDLKARAVIGCVGEGIICNEREVEGSPAISVWLGKWSNDIEISPFHLDLEQTSDGSSLLGWPDELLQANPNRSKILVLGDPRTFPVDVFLEKLNTEYPGLRVQGGMASGAWELGDCRLLLDGRIVHSGAVGLLLQGDVGLRSIVSQGCRPIGKHMIVTKGKGNAIEELGGRPALAQLQLLWQELDEKDRKLVQQGLHVGVVLNEYQGGFQRGDFLVRNVIGLDRDSGAMAITDRVRVGQTVQFHVRDAGTADADLHDLVKTDVSTHSQRPAGALLFSCNGRGKRLFDVSDHDTTCLRTHAGDIPVAGFFAAGELGPVGGRNFIHGFTASVALFEE